MLLGCTGLWGVSFLFLVRGSIDFARMLVLLRRFVLWRVIVGCCLVVCGSVRLWRGLVGRGGRGDRLRELILWC